MYAKVTATQSLLVTDPDKHKYVAVPHAKNFLDINRSVYLSKNALTSAIYLLLSEGILCRRRRLLKEVNQEDPRLMPISLPEVQTWS